MNMTEQGKFWIELPLQIDAVTKPGALSMFL